MTSYPLIASPVLALAAALAAAGCQRTEPRTEPRSEARGAARAEPTAASTTAPAPTPAPPPGAREPAPPLPDPLPGTRTDASSFAGGAQRAAIGDLDGDGASELVLADANQLRVLDRTGRQLAAAPAIAGIQVLVVADVDGDGRAEILAGWGASREHLAGPARVTLHRYHKGALTADTVFAPETARQDVVSVVPIPEEKSILIGYFDSKYMVSAVVARPAARGWQIDKLGTVRTASSFARGDVDGDGRPDVVVGRVYGDERGVDGDAFVLRPDGARTLIPTTRGLRSLAVVDADGDGALEVLVADGWHQNYGTTARALLTWSRYVDGAFRSELIEDTPGQYAIEKIVPARAGGRTLIVALGSSYVRVFARNDGRWQGLTIAGTARDVAVGDVDGKPGDELLILGDRTEIVGLADLPWPAR